MQSPTLFFMLHQTDVQNALHQANPLNGPHISLQLVTMHTLPQLASLAHQHSAALAPTLTWLTATDNLETITARLLPHIEKFWSGNQPLHSILWMISNENENLGMLNMQPKSGHPLKMELGYWIIPTHHNKGYASQALKLACHKLTHLFPNVSIEVQTYSTNKASIAAAQKAGFQLNPENANTTGISTLTYTG